MFRSAEKVQISIGGPYEKVVIFNNGSILTGYALIPKVSPK